jgi:hypothetical protein
MRTNQRRGQSVPCVVCDQRGVDAREKSILYVGFSGSGQWQAEKKVHFSDWPLLQRSGLEAGVGVIRTPCRGLRRQAANPQHRWAF